MHRAFVLALALWLAAPAFAAGNFTWDRAANIKDAAERLAGLQKERGALAAYKFISACYGTHMLASKYTQGLEACIAQDYMLTEVMTSIYARIPAEKRKEMGTVDPDQLARGMSQRVGAALTQYKMTEADGLALKKMIDQHGLPVFAKQTLPKASE